ncbi:MAG: D-alanyl-D-alanine carboxypeptidase/D-alanyl-D-alanine-endopeptidase [Nocardioidaceae bacterium]|nr:D-alanyl-D-alanine carboxypeptidase/D-alanyl-D-alanine-endopeptidase [Nocardioidaceae bacterium]
MRTRTTKAVIALTTTGLSLAGVSQLGAEQPTAGVSAAATAAAAPDAELGAALDEILDDPSLKGSMVSLVVRDAETGEALYQRNPNRRLNPASNAKLFSSSAALHSLRPDYRFTTEVLARGTGYQSRHALRSDLYLEGGGDPTVLADDYADMAAQLADAGITRVRGNLVTDDSFFDDVPLGVAWSWDDEPYYYSAVTSALTVAPDTDYDSGSVIVETSPGHRVNAPVRLSLVPKTGVIKLRNRATTGTAGSDNTISVDRRHASKVVVISGSMPLDDTTQQDWATVPDPSRYAGDVFRRALKAEGITVTGSIKPGHTPRTADVLASHESMTARRLMTPFLKLSNNMIAEALVKTMGREESGDGSWDAGLEVELAYAAALGVDTSTLRLSDGSGLSRFDLVSARNVTDLLLAVQDEPWFDTWYDALPIAGNPDRFVGGTLSSRMVGTAAANNLHGKTGSLTSVTALSGYVTNADDRDLVFSMISNNYLSSPRSLEDEVGIALASWSEEPGAKAPLMEPSQLRRASTYGPDDIECSWVKAC